MQAAEIRSAQLAKLLLSKGADVNLQNVFGHTALMRGCYRSAADVVDVLLAHGADPSLVDVQGRTARSVVEIDGGGTKQDTARCRSASHIFSVWPGIP